MRGAAAAAAAAAWLVDVTACRATLHAAGSLQQNIVISDFSRRHQRRYADAHRRSDSGRQRANTTDCVAFTATRTYCYEQEAQPSLTNRATHLCNMQWRGWSSRNTLPRCVKSPSIVILGQTLLENRDSREPLSHLGQVRKIHPLGVRIHTNA